MLNKTKVLPVLALFLSIAILYLALPRFIASLYAAYPQFIEDRVDAESIKIADEAYGDLERSLENANAWSVSAYHWQLKSLVATDAYFSKLDALTPDQKKTSLKKIAGDIVNGLTLTPLDSFGWYRLALIRSNDNHPSNDVIAPLKMSIVVQRVAPELLIRRITLLLDYKNDLDDAANEMLQGQIRLAWQFKRQALVKLMAEQMGYKDVFNRAFSNDPEQWQAVEKLIEASLKQSHQSQ